MVFSLFLSIVACGKMPQHASEEDLQEAKVYYDSGFVCLQQESLLQAFPHFISVAEKLEYLPENMTDEEMLLASRAYYQMAYVFQRKIENNAEIDALRWALGYQKTVQDTTWMIRSSLQLANAFSSLKENDSARYYLDFVMPYLDTVAGDLNDYFAAQLVLSDLYYDQHQFDSCFMVQRNTIAFKTRRGMSATNDSVSLGIGMYHSPYRLEAKPYLLKVLDMQTGDLELSAIMSLLEQIYEEEGNLDSAAFCHGFNKMYVKAESDRVSDGMLAVKQYEQYKAERDARLSVLREQKAQRKWVLLLVSMVLLVVIGIALFRSWHNRQMRLREEEADRQLQAMHGTLKIKKLETLRAKARGIYDDQRGNTCKRIMELFKTEYPNAMNKLAAAHPELNETELTVGVLAFLGFLVKETADIMDLRENTISKYRSALRKKTGIEDIEALISSGLQ